MVETEHLSDKAKYDFALVEAAKLGNQSAYAELMDRYRESIYYMMFKMVKNTDDADDLTIEAFGKAFDRLDQYTPSFAFSTWLFRVAYNETLNYIAQKKRLKTHSTQNELDHNLEHPSSQDTLKETAIQIKLERAIAELPEKQRFVFMLRYYEAFDYEKIASITGTTVGGAKANYHQAVKKMTELLQQA